MLFKSLQNRQQNAYRLTLLHITEISDIYLSVVSLRFEPVNFLCKGQSFTTIDYVCARFTSVHLD